MDCDYCRTFIDGWEEPIFLFQITSSPPILLYLILNILSTMSHRSQKLVPILPRGVLPRTFCEVCSKPHDGRYGSGRFCSKKCSRAVGGKARSQAYAQKRKTKTQKTTSSYMQFSVENPLTWNCETIVLHRLNSNTDEKTKQS